MDADVSTLGVERPTEIEAPDGIIYIPTYIPTIEETIKASGAHQQGGLQEPS